jgi:hypothetical protein
MNTILSPKNCPSNVFSVATQYIDAGCEIRPHAHERIEEILFLYEGHGMLTLEDLSSDITQVEGPKPPAAGSMALLQARWQTFSDPCNPFPGRHGPTRCSRRLHLPTVGRWPPRGHTSGPRLPAAAGGASFGHLHRLRAKDLATLLLTSADVASLPPEVQRAFA